MTNGILVCDLDESLVSVNTFPLFARFLVRRLATRGQLTLVISLVRSLLGRKCGFISHTTLKGKVIRAAERIPDDALRFWAGTVVTNYLNDEVATIVSQWEGTCVLSTAAPEIYAQHIGEILDFALVQGSLLGPEGCVDNHGSAKVDRLAKRFNLPVDVVVTDDEVADRPLLQVSRRAALVERRSDSRDTVRWAERRDF